jgi:hypothetical protein
VRGVQGCPGSGGDWIATLHQGKFSRTAHGVAVRPAAHQLVDLPKVLDDRLALPMIGCAPARKLKTRRLARSGHSWRRAAAMPRTNWQRPWRGAGSNRSCSAPVSTLLPIAILIRRCAYLRWTTPQPKPGSAGICRVPALRSPSLWYLRLLISKGKHWLEDSSLSCLAGQSVWRSTHSPGGSRPRVNRFNFSSAPWNLAEELKHLGFSVPTIL